MQNPDLKLQKLNLKTQKLKEKTRKYFSWIEAKEKPWQAFFCAFRGKLDFAKKPKTRFFPLETRFFPMKLDFPAILI